MKCKLKSKFIHKTYYAKHKNDGWAESKPSEIEALSYETTSVKKNDIFFVKKIPLFEERVNPTKKREIKHSLKFWNF